MGDAASQLADRLELSRLSQLIFELPLLRDVAADAKYADRCRRPARVTAPGAFQTAPAARWDTPPTLRCARACCRRSTAVSALADTPASSRAKKSPDRCGRRFRFPAAPRYDSNAALQPLIATLSVLEKNRVGQRIDQPA